MSWTPFLQAGAMAFFMGVALLHPRVQQGVFIKETWVNLFTGAVLFALRVLLVVVATKVGLETSGLISAEAIGHPGLQFLVAFLLLDFARYGVHYLDHRVPFLWHFHRVHHSSEKLNATSGLRMHAVDLLQLTAIPLVLFGLLLDSSTFAPWVIPTAIGLGILFDCFQHANISMSMESRSTGSSMRC